MMRNPANKLKKAARRIEPANHEDDLDDMLVINEDDYDPKKVEEEYPTGFKFAAIVVALTLSMFLASLDSTIVTSATPAITEEFNSLNDIGWYGSAVFLGFGATQPLWSSGFVYFPLKIVFMISMGVFELGSLLCAVAQNSVMFIVGRAILGAGSAGLCTGAYILVVYSAVPKWRPILTGWLGACHGLGNVAGPLLGGVFTEKVSWRWCFYINLPGGGVATVLILFFFRTPSTSKPLQATLKEKILRMDPIGSLLILASSICYLLAVQWGGVTMAWNSGAVVGLLMGFVLLLGFLVANEWHQGDRAFFSGKILGSWTRINAYAYNLIICASFFSLLYYMPIYFQVVLGDSAITSGVQTIPFLVAHSIASLVSGWSISAYGLSVPLVVFGGAIVTVGSGLIYTWGVSSSEGTLIGYQIITGAGNGLVMQVPMIIIQAVTPAIDVSAATAVALFFQTIGGSFWVSTAQSIFQNRLLGSLSQTNPDLDPLVVLNAGTEGFKTDFPPSEQSGIRESYMQGLKGAFVLGIVTSGLSTLLGAAQKWKRHGQAQKETVELKLEKLSESAREF